MARFYTTTEDEIVYKKVRTRIPFIKEYLLECLIPAGTKCFGSKAKRGARNDRKNRAEKIVPIAFYEEINGLYRLNKGDNLKLTRIKSADHVGFYDATPLTYTLNEVVVPDDFSQDASQCTHGIHFFYNPDDALGWR